jgi:hypothetical protein
MALVIDPRGSHSRCKHEIANFNSHRQVAPKPLPNRKFHHRRRYRINAPMHAWRPQLMMDCGAENQSKHLIFRPSSGNAKLYKPALDLIWIKDNSECAVIF